MSDPTIDALAAFFSFLAIIAAAAAIIFYLQACKAEIQRQRR